MESIDDLLAQLKNEYEEKDNPSQAEKQPSMTLETAMQESLSPAKPPITFSQATNFNPLAEDRLITELKTEFAEKEKAEELQRQQLLLEEQRRQEAIKQQQRQAITKEAQAWLKKLNPRSEEGLWFEEFAYDYPSKLDAAIDYLQALKEVKP